ncbi:MAG: NUDIX domain-containing protein [Chloroflexota bacterium]
MSDLDVPRAAATVVLLRPTSAGHEVLLTRRPRTMAFGPDIHVFPGGRVDSADAAPAAHESAGITAAEAAQRLGLGLAPDGQMTAVGALAHHVAAVRETLEETGIVIAAADLVAMSRWVTPGSMARRFDVRFFAAFVPAGTRVSVVSEEVEEARWVRPADALEAAAAGQISLWQPTFVTLQQLVELRDEADLRAAFLPGSVSGGPTFRRVSADVVEVEASWAAGIPGRRARGWLIGRQEVVVVDPADPTHTTIEQVHAEVARSGGRLAGVVVTDLEPLHHAGVEMFAHGLGLPVGGPPDAAVRAPYALTGLTHGEELRFGDVAVSVDIAPDGRRLSLELPDGRRLGG